VQSKNDSKSYNGKRTQRGVSLIEVLVVLVILVTGILTIIRLFPSGFFSIQSTGNAALANSLGSAAIDLGAQSAESLPDSILPDDLAMDDLASAVANSAAYSNYDPDDPNNLENARVVQNETITVPTAVNGQSVYVVKYGPVVMPADPTQTAAQLPSYFTVNSP
jgi:prepilin-type N-terminal cleavage/methylation domain-containing protein